MQKILIFIVILFFSNTVKVEESTSMINCEKSDIVVGEKEFLKKRAIAGAATGLGCMYFLYIAAIDGGISTIICSALAMSVGVASINTDTANEVSNKNLENPECKK